MLARPAPRHVGIALILLLALLKLGLLAGDPTIRLYLGDSASYLHSAMTGWVPGDRSFVYGWLLGWLVVPTGTLLSVGLLQSLLGILTAWLVYKLARCSFGLDYRPASILAVVYALLPSELFFERMVMAEAFGTASLALMFAAGFRYVDRRDWRWLPAIALAGMTAVSFRMSLLPVVLGFSVLPVLVAWTTPEPAAPRRWPKYLLHLSIALAATGAAHLGYQHLYGAVAETEPDYIADNGYFRLGLVAPLVKREQIVRVGLPADLLDRVGPKLSDPRTREAQIWLPDGLIALVRANAGDQGNRVARKLATRALHEDPIGFLRLAGNNLLDYFEPSIRQSRLLDEIGTRVPEDEFAARLQERFDYDAKAVAGRMNPMARYFHAMAPWMLFCLFGTPIVALIALYRNWRERRAAALLLALTALGLFLSHALFAHIPSFRYLHPQPFLLLIAIGAILARRRIVPQKQEVA